MTQTDENINDEVENTPIIFQWLKTEKAGQYSVFVREEHEDDLTYIVFEDGSRVNKNLLGDYAIEVTDENDGYIIKEEIINDVIITKGADGKEYEVPGPAHGKVKRVKVKKPGLKNVPKHLLNRKPSKQVNEDVPVKNQVEEDPLRILLNKTKLERNSYDITLSIEVIPTNLFNDLKDSFEDGEESMIKYMMELLDIESLKNQFFSFKFMDMPMCLEG